MIDRRLLYCPVMLYLLLLAAVWLLSWGAEVWQLLSGTDGGVVPLLSEAGVRWTLFSVRESLNAAPWGTMAFMVIIAGLLSGSGILQFLGRLMRRQKTSVSERRSMVLALLALLLYCTLLFLFTVSPWDTLMGVTGYFGNSPLVHGWILVLFFAVLAVSLTYGFIYGNYRTAVDVIVSAGDIFSLFIPAFMAMLPASGIVPGLQYTGLDASFGLDVAGLSVFETVVYTLPFVYVCLLVALKRR